MIGLALHYLARAVDHVREAAAPLGWVWTYGNPSRQQLREEASYWRQRAHETEAALDRITAETAELRAAARGLVAAEEQYQAALDAAEKGQTGAPLPLASWFEGEEAWDRLVKALPPEEP